jgi:membrane associated rhomboid family serine protease
LPVVTIAIVLVNVVAYLLAIRHGGDFFGGPSEKTAVRWGAIPYELTHPGDHCQLTSGATVCQGRHGAAFTPSSQPATAITVFTAMFLSGGFLQLVVNMWFLAVFGPTVEDAMSRPRFALFYVLGGIVALAAVLLAGPGSTGPTLGATGAVAAVLGGYMLLHPRGRVVSLIFVIFFFTIVEIPAVVLLGVWLALDGVAAAIHSAGSEGIAYLAHAAGGFLFGLVAIRAFVKRLPPEGRTPAAGLA